ncbi:MAG: hypothetical protein WAR83_14755 [Flavobacteriales bacterium]|nr:hypothetical protein [Flavobacteriales bacterium]
MMKQVAKDLPLSMVTLVFGALSVPLAFARHLVSLAFVIGVLAILFALWGKQKHFKHFLLYTPASLRRSRLGYRLAIAGTLCSVIMWILWARNVLF